MRERQAYLFKIELMTETFSTYMDLDFLLVFGAWGLFFLTPFWLPVALLLIWKKSILFRFKFIFASAFILMGALMIAFYGVNSLADFGLNYYYFAGNECKPEFVCQGFNFLNSYRVAFWAFIYTLFLITFIVTIRTQNPRWLGFSSKSVAVRKKKVNSSKS